MSEPLHSVETAASAVTVVSDDAIAAALANVVERAALATLAHEGIGAAAELTVALVSAEEIRSLNQTYRGVDAETDVLSFGMEEGPALASPACQLRYLGDVAISVGRAEAQAHEYGHSVERELAFLTVHGVLHLLGHDHDDPEEQRWMRAAEEAVLNRLGLSREPAERAESQ